MSPGVPNVMAHAISGRRLTVNSNTCTIQVLPQNCDSQPLRSKANCADESQKFRHAVVKKEGKTWTG